MSWLDEKGGQLGTESKLTVNKRCMDDWDSKLLFLMIIGWLQKPNRLQMTHADQTWDPPPMEVLMGTPSIPY